MGNSVHLVEYDFQINRCRAIPKHYTQTTTTNTYPRRCFTKLYRIYNSLLLLYKSLRNFFVHKTKHLDSEWR